MLYKHLAYGGLVEYNIRVLPSCLLLFKNNQNTLIITLKPKIPCSETTAQLLLGTARLVIVDDSRPSVSYQTTKL